jgi:hypothetical protein
MTRRRSTSIGKGGAGCLGLLVLLLAMLGKCGQSSSPRAASTPFPVRAAATLALAATEAADTWTRQPPTVAPTSKIDIKNTAPAVPAATPDPPPPTNTPTPTALPAGPVVKSSANLRKGPGTTYPVAGGVKPGTPLTIVARNAAGDWLKLSTGAWIAAFLVDRVPSVPVAKSIPPPPTARPTARPKPTVTSVPVRMAVPTYDGPPGCAGNSGARYGAVCNDGTYSGATGRGACSHHGGVNHWLVCP